MLLCGSFNDTTSVTAEKIKNKDNSIDGYKVSVNDCYTNDYKVRYLPSSDNSDVYVDYGNGMQKVNTKSYGSYREFRVKNPRFSVYEMKKDYTMYILYVLFVLALILTIIFILKKLKKKESD